MTYSVYFPLRDRICSHRLRQVVDHHQSGADVASERGLGDGSREYRFGGIEEREPLFLIEPHLAEELGWR